MREIKLRYVCKDLMNNIFILYPTIWELERGLFNIEHIGRIQEILSKDLYAELKSRDGKEIYAGDIAKFSSKSDGEWVSVVSFDDGMFTVDYMYLNQIKNPDGWKREHDWVKSRNCGCTIGYPEYGTWNHPRLPLVSMGVMFSSYDEMIPLYEIYGHEDRIINVEIIGNKWEHPELIKRWETPKLVNNKES